MVTGATVQKRQDLMSFIERILAHEPAVQAVVGIGSIASGLARPDSDIDAVLFLDPLDLYVVPAESRWCPADGSYHSIFSDDPRMADSLQLDFHRYDLNQWADPSFTWPEERCAELRDGWIAFDRSDNVAKLIENRTAYTDATRLERLDEAIIWLDQHLSGQGPQKRWDSLGLIIANDRLQAAYEYLVQGLFAYNRQWRPWRNREMSSLLELPWLPDGFADRIMEASNTSSNHYAAYSTRVDSLISLSEDLTTRLIIAGDYGDDVVSEAFVRRAEEPGRAWNMDEWNRKHAERSRES